MDDPFQLFFSIGLSNRIIKLYIEAISKVAQNVRKSLLRPVKWSVFGGYPSSFAEATEDKLGSHTQTAIFSSSTIFFQPNFAGLLKLPLLFIAGNAVKAEKNRKFDFFSKKRLKF